MKYKAKCTECPKVFNRTREGRLYESQSAADAALRMHVARRHTKTIINTPPRPAVRRANLELVGKNGAEHGASNVIASFESPATHSRHSKLSSEQQDSIVQFIRNRRAEFSTKSKCFSAALEANNAVGVIKNNGSAVERYYAKATGTVKRKYTKRAVVPATAFSVAPVAHKTINFCETCGNNLKAQALGSVIAGRLAAGAVVTIDGQKVEYAS